MRILLRVTPADQAWLVQIAAANDPGTVLHTRRLRQIGTGRASFPLPPAGEVPATAGHHPLCEPADAGRHTELLANITSRDLHAGDVPTFGRYLFATLLGEAIWADLRARAAGAPLELALMLDAERTDLPAGTGLAYWAIARLPWELMHGPDNFLAGAGPDAAVIVRVVPGTQRQLPAYDAPLRVLFAVGTTLDDAQIRPGAEYLGLLRRLEAQGRAIAPRLLLDASGPQIEEAVRSFEPAIVHLICHGRVDGSQVFVTLRNDDQAAGPPGAAPAARSKEYSAAQLRTLLTSGPQVPAVVVVNACYSATQATAQQSVPLAAELVRGGVPFVIGMAGRVADRACRLFTHGFYQALLAGDGAGVAAAAAAGRRTGMLHGADPASSVDWAFPTVYLAEQSPAGIQISDTARARQLVETARQFRILNNPEVFCGRLDLQQDYAALLDPNNPVTILAIEITQPDQSSEDPRYGKTRLLEQLAAQAVAGGHVPVLLSVSRKDGPPATLQALCQQIMLAIDLTRRRFQLNRAVTYEIARLIQAVTQPGAAVALHPEVAQETMLRPLPQDQSFASVALEVVRAALRVDLQQLCSDAATVVPKPSQARVIVLLDDVHRFDAAAEALLDEHSRVLDTFGLGVQTNPIPLVFTFSRAAVSQEYAVARAAFTRFLAQKRSYVRHIEAGAFEPRERRFVYQQVLLHHTENQKPVPLIYPPGATLSEDDLIALIDEEVKGIPSALQQPNPALNATIRAALYGKWLVPADDDALLAPGGS